MHYFSLKSISWFLSPKIECEGSFAVRVTECEFDDCLTWGIAEPEGGFEIPRRLAIRCWADGTGRDFDDAMDLLDN